MCRKNATFKIFAVVISKEGLAGGAQLIFLVDWLIDYT